MAVFPVVFVYGQNVDNDNNDTETQWQVIQSLSEVLWRTESSSDNINSRSVWETINRLKNFIQNYPDSIHLPEAYYLLGVAYSHVNYMPEAEAHWMICAKYYPETSWAGDSLSMLARYLEEKGSTQRLESFYKKLVQSFPRSHAALALETVLGIEELEKGRLDLAKAVVRDVENKKQNAEIAVPRLLDLKARIALASGNTKKARKEWIHYLNLIKSPEIRADILYKIAESYRKEGRPLDAHKYYAFIKRDFPFAKESSFARFRMAELEERARERMAGYVSGMGFRNLTKVDNLYSDIIRKYPAHPITTEVMSELIQIKLDENRNLQALQLAQEFSQKYPSGTKFDKKVQQMAEQAANSLAERTDNIVAAEAGVNWCKTFIGNESNNRIEALAAQAGIKLWRRLLEMLLENKEYYRLLRNFDEYRKIAGRENPYVKKGAETARSAAAFLSEKLLSGEHYVDLLNYYYYNKALLDSLKTPGFLLSIGKAWKGAGSLPAAMDFLYREYKFYASTVQAAAALVELAEVAVSYGRPEDAQNALMIRDSIIAEEGNSPKVSLLKAEAALANKEWLAAFNMAKDSLASNSTAGRGAEVAFMASVQLGQWEYAARIWNRFYSKFANPDKALRIWGDTALNLLEPDAAIEAYTIFKERDSEDMATDWKITRAEELKGNMKKAEEMRKELAGRQQDSIWSKAAQADSSYAKFINGPAGELL